MNLDISSPAEPSLEPVTPVHVPANPDRRYVDLIEASLRELCRSPDDAPVLEALARVIDRHIAGSLDSVAASGRWLHEALDDALSAISPAMTRLAAERSAAAPRKSA